MERRGLNEVAPIRLFCSDLDGTLVGNPEGSRRFAQAWMSIPEPDRPILCYASGRLLAHILELLPRVGLPAPDYVIAGVGTEIYDVRAAKVMKELSASFDQGWDRAAIDRVVSQLPGTAPQPSQLLTEHKSSWFLHRASPAEIEALRRRLGEAGLEATIVYSSLRDLDILPKLANKGNALKWLMGRLGVDAEEVLVAGDKRE